MDRRRLIVAGLAAAAATPSAAKTVVNARALSGDRFRAGGADYQLADILAPSPHHLHRDAQPFYIQARNILADLIDERPLRIANAGAPNRWGEHPVQARLEGDERAIQERLVEAGAARVAPASEDHGLIDRLLAAEGAARDQKRGLWRLDAYSVVDAAAADRAVGAYHLIEGSVLRAALAKNRFYLNFGDDYRSDFTASAPSRLYRRWAKQGFDLAALSEARVRIRGFVERINGASIALAHRQQIEIVSSSGGARL